MVFRIYDRATGDLVGSYNSRSYHDQFDFPSAEAARDANVNGLFKDRKRYRIAEVRTIETIIDFDVDA